MPWESESISPEMRRRYQEADSRYRRIAQSVVQANAPSPRRTPASPESIEMLRLTDEYNASGLAGEIGLAEYYAQNTRRATRESYSTNQHERRNEVEWEAQRIRETLVAEAVDSGIEPEDGERIHDYVQDALKFRGEEIEAEYPALAEAVRETAEYPAANVPEILTRVRRMAPDFADVMLRRELLRSEADAMNPHVQYALHDNSEEGARRTLKVGITHDVVDEVVTGKETYERLRQLMNQVAFDDPSPMPVALSEDEFFQRQLAALPLDEHTKLIQGGGAELRSSGVLVVTPSTEDSPEPSTVPASERSLSDLDAAVAALRNSR